MPDNPALRLCSARQPRGGTAFPREPRLRGSKTEMRPPLSRDRTGRPTRPGRIPFTRPGQRAGNSVPALKPSAPSKGGTPSGGGPGEPDRIPPLPRGVDCGGPPARGMVPGWRIPAPPGHSSSTPGAQSFPRPRGRSIARGTTRNGCIRAPLRQTHGAPRARSLSGPGRGWVTRLVGRPEGQRRFRRASGIPCPRPGTRPGALWRVRCTLVPFDDARSGSPGPDPTGFPLEARSPRRQCPTCRAQSFPADLLQTRPVVWTVLR